jgi:hypothetical protein
MKWLCSLAALTLAGLILGALPGCGGSANRVKITGKFVKNGQPFEVSKGTYVTLTFADSEKDGSYIANYSHASGTYEVTVPPGKYRLQYHIQEKAQQALTPPKDKVQTIEVTGAAVVDIVIASQ